MGSGIRCRSGLGNPDHLFGQKIDAHGAEHGIHRGNARQVPGGQNTGKPGNDRRHPDLFKAGVFKGLVPSPAHQEIIGNEDPPDEIMSVFLNLKFLSP